MIKKQRKVKSKIIDMIVLLKKPKHRLIRIVIISDSIDSAILDLQEKCPNENLNRKSVLHWKFLTVEDYNKLQCDMNGELLNTEQEAEESDTTNDK